jgi:hypothetical protein
MNDTASSTSGLAMKAVAVVVLLAAAWILLKVVIGVLTTIAWIAVLVGAVVAVLGLGLSAIVRMRADRLAASFREALGGNATRDTIVDALLIRLGRAWAIRWGGYVSWLDDGLGGTLELSRGQGPPEAAVVSWLVREAESGLDLIAAPGAEVGRDGMLLALPLRRDNSAIVGFIVVEAERTLPRHVDRALRATLDEIGLALADRPVAARSGQVLRLSVVQGTSGSEA